MCVPSAKISLPFRLRLTSGKPNVRNDRRGKVPKGVQRVGHEKVLDGEDPEHGRRDSRDEVILVKVLVGPLGRKLSHSTDRPIALLVVEPFGGSIEETCFSACGMRSRQRSLSLRIIRQEEVDEDPDDDSRDAFEDESAA